jgi:hypothetical protein
MSEVGREESAGPDLDRWLPGFAALRDYRAAWLPHEPPPDWF